MKIQIIIHRNRKNNNKIHNGVLVFENGPTIDFKINDDQLHIIHNHGSLTDTHTEEGKNIYQGTFEFIELND